jgi:hypothetical protein
VKLTEVCPARAATSLRVGDGRGDADELWRNAQGHMGVLHPELVGNVTRDDLLAQAEQL